MSIREHERPYGAPPIGPHYSNRIHPESINTRFRLIILEFEAITTEVLVAKQRINELREYIFENSCVDGYVEKFVAKKAFKELKELERQAEERVRRAEVVRRRKGELEVEMELVVAYQAAQRNFRPR
ncbi:hypothetical protein TWF281_008048 [Arthrobotrys megalospora]